ncbi:hypothetical protein J2S98_002513 [Arthrobacter oryzae]|nr:hypothetical protein [Arthrobacter oryzae]
MTEDVPATLQPPVPLALAKAVESVPAEAALPGGSVYEPKWDGFRMCALIGTAGVSLWSRQGKDLTRYSVGGQAHPQSFCLLRARYSVRYTCRALTSAAAARPEGNAASKIFTGWGNLVIVAGAWLRHKAVS